MRKLSQIIFFFILFSTNIIAQPAFLLMQKTEYVDRYKEIAIKQMMEFCIPASITLAQAVVESQYGNSPLALSANNHFGIKCKATWAGPSFTMDDDAANECFRKYQTVEESFEDHSKFLRSRKWYNPLFELNLTDYKAWAYGQKTAGYATQMLIAVIEDLGLYKYDNYFKVSPIILPRFKTSERSLKMKYEHQRFVYFLNKAQYIEAQRGDTYMKISYEFNISVKDLLIYNDCGDNNELINEGERIYITEKRIRSRTDSYNANGSETIRQIAQKFGVRVSSLEKLNNLKSYEKPLSGAYVCLSKKCN